MLARMRGATPAGRVVMLIMIAAAPPAGTSSALSRVALAGAGSLAVKAASHPPGNVAWVPRPAELRLRGGCAAAEAEAEDDTPTALERVNIELLTDMGENGTLSCSFKPLFAHQVFGQNETLPPGCDTLNISYSAVTLLPAITAMGKNTTAAETCVRENWPADWAGSRDELLREEGALPEGWRLVSSYGEAELSGRTERAAEALRLRRGGRVSTFEVRFRARLSPPPARAPLPDALPPLPVPPPLLQPHAPRPPQVRARLQRAAADRAAAERDMREAPPLPPLPTVPPT